MKEPPPLRQGHGGELAVIVRGEARAVHRRGERGACRRANRRIGERIVEGQPMLGQFVDVWRGGPRGVEQLEVVLGIVLRDDKHDVRPIRRLRGVGGEERSGEPDKEPKPNQ